MPFGATPSRWCVCQFHHFRTRVPHLVQRDFRQKRRGTASITNSAPPKKLSACPTQIPTDRKANEPRVLDLQL